MRSVNDQPATNVAGQIIRDSYMYGGRFDFQGAKSRQSAHFYRFSACFSRLRHAR